MDSSKTYTESIFMDSGAHSLRYETVVKKGGRIGKHGRELETVRPALGQGDFSFYDLRAGTSFRKYCDAYAKLIKKCAGTDVMWVTVDVIGNPDLSWDIHSFFLQEHGLWLVPVVHCGTSMAYVDRYLETGKCDLLGMGGVGWQSRTKFIEWADQLFLKLCPESNKYLPLIRTHGFAVTSWLLMLRYPWWSVDSATWVKLAAYGWLYIPRWNDSTGWCYHKPPMQINTSFRSPFQKVKDKHFDNLSNRMQDVVGRWLEHCGVVQGSVDKEGEEVEYGVRSNFKARSRCNLIYFKGIEAHKPEWPCPLNPEIIRAHVIEHRKGFAL
jgi:hypothetical protein